MLRLKGVKDGLCVCKNQDFMKMIKRKVSIFGVLFLGDNCTFKSVNGESSAAPQQQQQPCERVA